MSEREPLLAPHRIDRQALARSFDRASASYDAAAQLQTEVRAELLSRLDYAPLVPAVVLDLGAGTAHATRALRRRYRRALVIAADIAPGMLEAARRQSGFLRRFERIRADAYRLPLADASVDLVFSSLMLQWCDDLGAVFAEIRRVVKPGGLFTFSSFGPDTLRELRAAWASVDRRAHVNRFIDMHDVGDALGQAGFGDPVLDVDRHVASYDDVLGLMRDLKALGAHNVSAGRARGLTGRGALAALTAAYETHRRQGKLPATYEVIYGNAWGTAVPGPRERLAGTGIDAVVPLSQIGRRDPSSH
jgi:malonyl-CoA O-methyltransferase